MALSNMASSIAKDLASQLTARQPFAAGQSVLAVVSTNDTDGYPLITVGTSGTLNRHCVIKVMPESVYATQTDVLGNTQFQYGPTKIMIAKEANYVGTTDNVVDPLKSFDLLALYCTAAKHGCKVEVWEEATGVVPASTTFSTASKLKGEWYPDVFRPLVNQI